MNRLVAAAVGGFQVALLVGAACGDGSGPGTGSGGDGAGGCPTEPAALFTLHVRAREGSVPPDTRLRVVWSAAEEPEFALDDPSTWKTLEEDSNVECDVDRDASVPLDLEELVCELWTGGTTEVTVSAAGYVSVAETFTPAAKEGCDAPVPSDVHVELVRDLDAGVQ